MSPREHSQPRLRLPPTSAEEQGVEDLWRQQGPHGGAVDRYTKSGITTAERLGVGFVGFLLVMGVNVWNDRNNREDRARDRVFHAEQIKELAKAQREDRDSLTRALEKLTNTTEQGFRELNHRTSNKDRR